MPDFSTQTPGEEAGIPLQEQGGALIFSLADYLRDIDQAEASATQLHNAINSTTEEGTTSDQLLMAELTAYYLANPDADETAAKEQDDSERWGETALTIFAARSINVANSQRTRERRVELERRAADEKSKWPLGIHGIQVGITSLLPSADIIRRLKRSRSDNSLVRTGPQGLTEVRGNLVAVEINNKGGLLQVMDEKRRMHDVGPLVDRNTNDPEHSYRPSVYVAFRRDIDQITKRLFSGNS